MAKNSADPDRIERNLDQTRARLDSHLSELQDRLSPGQVLDDLMGYFRGSEGADFGRSLLDNVKSNPLPAALTGIGLAWLMASSPRQGAAGQALASASTGRVRVSGANGPVLASYDAPSSYDAMNARLRDAELGVTRQQDEVEHVYHARLHDARGQAIGLARQAQETTESFSQRIQEVLSAAKQTIAQGASAATQAVGQGAQGVRDQVGGAAGQVSGAAQHAGQYAGDQLAHGSLAARQMSGNLIAAFADSPVLLGALGLAAGALLGALVPQSDQEEAALGGIAGQTRVTARDLAQDVVDRGGRVAQTVFEAGRSSVSEHGLTSGKSAGTLVDAALGGDLADNAKQVAQDVLRAGDEAVRKEGLGKGQGGSKPT